MSRTALPPRWAAHLIVISLALAACAPVTEAARSTASPTGGQVCRKGSMPTLDAGKLTVGVELPALPPFYINSAPDNGQGFESALTYAIAKELGYDKQDVAWVNVLFDHATQPGRKPYDVDVNEFTITPERAEQVDFSKPYYTNYQTVVVLDPALVSPEPRMSQLRKLQFGVQTGTTSFAAVTDFVKPTKEPLAYGGHEEVKAALRAGQIQALVVDLPTATLMANFQVQGARVLGKIAPEGVPPEKFGIVLDKGSPLTSCMDEALQILQTDKTLDVLEQEWLSQGPIPKIVND